MINKNPSLLVPGYSGYLWMIRLSLIADGLISIGALKSKVLSVVRWFVVYHSIVQV